MRLLADECCDRPLVEALRAAGHDVLFVPDATPGAPDADGLGRAYAEDRLLSTEDKDFGELVVRLGLDAHGVILLRFSPSDETLKSPRLLDLLARYGDRLRGRFVVVTADRYRLRPI